MKCALPEKNNFAIHVRIGSLWVTDWSDPKFSGDLIELLVRSRTTTVKRIAPKWLKGRVISDLIKFVDTVDLDSFEYEIVKPGGKRKVKVSEIDDRFKSQLVHDREQLQIVLPMNYMDQYDNAWSLHFKQDLILEYTQQRFGIKLDSYRNLIVIPHYKHDEPTALLGVKARHMIPPVDCPKYFYDSDGYVAKNNLYGLSVTRNDIIKSGLMIVVESEKSVMKLDNQTVYHSNGVAIGKKHISEAQVKIISGFVNEYPHVEVVVALDNDVSTDDVLIECNKLWKAGVKKLSYIKDVDGYLGEKDSPPDNLHKYKELLEKRKIFNDFTRIEHTMDGIKACLSRDAR